jgi:hypothetical protein
VGFWVPCFALVLSRWEWLCLYIALGDVFKCCSVCAFGLDVVVCSLTTPHLSNFRFYSACVLVPLMAWLPEMHSVFLAILAAPQKRENIFILPSCMSLCVCVCVCVCVCARESHSSFRLGSYFHEYSYHCYVVMSLDAIRMSSIEQALTITCVMRVRLPSLILVC